MTKREIIEAMDADAENPEITLEQFIAKVEEVNAKQNAENTFTNVTKEDINNMIKEDKTMMNINEIKTTFVFENCTYTEKTNGYCFVTENGKTRRIKAAELEQAFDSYIQAGADAAAQAELDEEPCMVDNVEIENNFDGDTHFWTVRVNGKAVSNHYNAEEAKEAAKKLGWHDEQEETTVEEPKVEEPKTEKPKTKRTRKSKDIGFEHSENGKTVVTLTAKQVDFIRHLPDTPFWEHGLDSSIFVDCLCDDIGGQFENKPMTVGAMISTLCEKGLGSRVRDTSRKGKPIVFTLTEMGKRIAKELGLD